MTATPNPSVLAKRNTLAQQATVQAVVAETTPSDPAVEPAGVIKAKNARKGQVVRAWLKGEARGGEYTIAEKPKRSEDGSMVHIKFEQPCQRPDDDYKAAYRFFVVKDVPAQRRARRQPPEHLTYQPFGDLKELVR